jgi:hypothetical protein
MFNIIFKRLFNNINDTTTYLNSELEKNKISNINFYELIEVLPKNKLLLYITISIICFVIFRNLEINLSIIFCFIITASIIFFLLSKDKNQKEDFIKDNNLKIHFLLEIMYDSKNVDIFFDDKVDAFIRNKDKFYLQENQLFIELMYSTKESYLLSPNNFVSVLRNTNILFGLHKDLEIGVTNPFENLKNGIFYYKKAMNAFESLIHSSKYSNYTDFDKRTELLQSILLNVLQKMINICKNKNKEDGLTTQSIPNNNLDELLFVEANDTETETYMPNYNYF